MREMKNSGVAWIGEIPTDWNVVALKRLCSMQAGKNLTSEQIKTSGEYPVYGGNGLRGYFDEFNNDGEYLLVGRQGALCGNVHRVTGRFWATEHAVVTEPSPLAKIDFLHYLLIAMDLNQYASNVAAQPGLSVNAIQNVKTCLAPLAQQKRIAALLDKECVGINAVLDKTLASIEEYKKLKQAIITQAVTKGIWGDRSMKESGIEWVGEMPSHWSIRRIKTLFSLRDERNTLPLSEVNLISLYTDQGVVQHADLEKTTGNKASTAEGYKKVHANDVVVNIILCWMGAIGRSAYEGVTSPAYDIYVPSSDIECQFYHYYFRTVGFSGECYKRGRGIMAMRWRTYSDQFRDIPVAFPPLEEQQAIVKYLDEMCSQIDDLIAKKEKVVSELESYKKSLIYEYVTGKKEVP